jgi:hypothetical protein
MYPCDYSFFPVGVGPPTVNHDIERDIDLEFPSCETRPGFQQIPHQVSATVPLPSVFGGVVFSEGSRAEEL